MAEPREPAATGNYAATPRGPAVPYYQYLDAEGRVQRPLPGWAADPEPLQASYRIMQRTRCFDARAIALQRTGQLGTYGSSLGQEAVGAAIGAAMRREDVLLPTYREYAAQLLRGVAMHELLLYWGGDERGMAFKDDAVREDFPICVPIAGHAPHAVGVAAAFQYRQQPRVAVCVLGDGGSSKGDFYEALNLAGIWQLPVVFVIVNNQWAISVRRSQQSGTPTLAQKAIAAGLPGELVDGNDVIALRERLQHAIDHARAGQGATVIEALTWRLGDHTTADDASRYRSDAEVEAARASEPLKRLRNHLRAQGHWDDAREQRLLETCKQEVEQEVQRYLDTPPPAPEAMFEHLHAELPATWAAQPALAAGRGKADDDG